MPATLPWLPNPRARRVFADLAEALRIPGEMGPRVALLVGAGVDHALAERDLWQDFIAKLGGRNLPQGELAALQKLATKWPVEAAEALRIASGRARYEQAIRLETPRGKLTGQAMRDALRSLVAAGIRVIVSFNYTRDVERAVTAHSTNHTTVIQRVHFGGWTKLDLLHPAGGELHLIAIHGLVDGKKSEGLPPVLDQQTYDDAIFSDLHYSDFLQRLLQDYTVLSVGVSWTDVVLRNAAARVHYAAPISSRIHVAMLSSKRGAGVTGHEAREIEKFDVWQERAFVGAYSVRPVYYSEDNSHAECAQLLQSLPGLKHDMGRALGADREDGARKRRKPTLRNIARILDLAGDYESLFHREWFSCEWERIRDLIIATAPKARSLSDWLPLARIERHLRHFLWVYDDPRAREASRRNVWNAVARAWESLAQAERDPFWERLVNTCAKGEGENLDHQGFFDFALGAYEVFGSDCPTGGACLAFRALLRELRGRAADSKQALRAHLAEDLWLPATLVDPTLLYKLRQRAIDCGWEAMEAKLALDECERRFQLVRGELQAKRDRAGAGARGKLAVRTDPVCLREDLSTRKRTELQRCALDAREAARVAGCGRRELGAVALGALIATPEKAEAELIGIQQSFSKRVKAGAGPVGEWGVYVSLLATLVDRYGKRPISAVQAKRWLEERCGRIDQGLLTPTLVDQVLGAYWGKYHPQAALLAKRVAELARDARPHATKRKRSSA